MKTKTPNLLRASIALLGLAAAAFAAAPADLPQFNAILTIGKDQRFGLTSTDGHSGFVNLGADFHGYKLASYDAPAQTLVLERDSQQHRILIATATVGTSVPAATKATLADAQAVINQIKFEDMILKSLEGQKKAMAQISNQMAKRKGTKIGPADLEAHQNKVMDALAEAMDIPKLKTEVAQIYSEIFSKAELQAMSAFHSTPAGQAMIDKQPDIQARMQSLIMPRMMAAMPKIQEMGKQFAAEQKAKADAAKAAATPPADAAAAPIPVTTPAPKTN